MPRLHNSTFGIRKVQMDPSAIERRDQQLFNEIAESYSRKDLFGPSRIARRLRLDATWAGVSARQDVDVLEVGCGAGFAARYLAGRYGRYMGVDHAESLVALARRHHQLPNVRFESAGVHELSSAERFDVILLIGVLHHLDDLPASLTRMVELLKPGGWLVANEPQRANPVVGWLRAVRKRVDREYSRDQRQFTASELRSALEQARLTDVRVWPQGWFSTPFAEVPLRPALATWPVAALACALDRAIARLPSWSTGWASWNLAAAGRRINEQHKSHE
jgi:2-polyprenyl-3-methyl-5-hydroxy-6-metoxy-1,4-benzoquinol methylase